ncbi:MAG: hypothetical protein DYG83_13230 [Candidatus Brocadia sp. AMX2]|uniref:Uncharacterized protein n=1 Tax=Candidatus Brocadia sinica JPN1 TaxID=1197129 RepID=A0ABQ0JYT5_9BACT|nr:MULTISPECIES: hypothetical protein [Brocadia]MBC6932209.1 hypothetical protein [Candidatus Brocadia sp.]MBL1168481.1 hypothetical protein [Candidatus Brocadia sp. AMX1]NOG40235.1 hypothetical protein [Planctomycetota bacterium]NUQ57689.1 hypothetical protein [Candidatus Paceibacter sp.]GIK14205.1 MAG: hypothetical protein BroJett002_29120 [Candidatus Brocadia sinica]
MEQEENKSSGDAWDILVNRHGIAYKDEYEPIFEQLEKTIEKSLLERIKHTKKRCVLLVGSDKDLIRKIACLIYCYSDTFGFHYVDCLNEKNIDDKLSQFKRGTVFLEDIDSKDLPLIKRIDTRITDFLNAGSGLSYTFNGVKKTTPQGQLIISASDADNLPQYFTSKFNIIPLEPAKKDLPASTQQDIQKITALFYDDAKSILFLDDEKCCELTKDEQALVDYLRQDSQHFSDIITHFQSRKEYSNTNWSRGNFDNLQSDLNKKTVKKLGVKLIQNLEKRSGKYGLFVKIKDKKFKK